DVDRALLRDERIERLRALIDDKLARGVDVEKAPEAEEAEDEAEIIDLMEVLKRRLQPEQREAAPAARRSAGAERRETAGTRDGGDDLESRSKSQLYERAKALNVPGRRKMDKGELVRALREAGGLPAIGGFVACDLLRLRLRRLAGGSASRAGRSSRAPRGESNETGTAKAGHDTDRHLSRLLQCAAAASLSVPRLLLSFGDARGNTRSG